MGFSTRYHIVDSTSMVSVNLKPSLWNLNSNTWEVCYGTCIVLTFIFSPYIRCHNIFHPLGFVLTGPWRRNLLHSPSGTARGLPCVNHTPKSIQIEPIHHMLAVMWAAVSVNLEKIMYLCSEMTSHNETVILYSVWFAICDKDEFHSEHGCWEAVGPGQHGRWRPFSQHPVRMLPPREWFLRNAKNNSPNWIFSKGCSRVFQQRTIYEEKCIGQDHQYSLTVSIVYGSNPTVHLRLCYGLPCSHM